MKMNKLTIKENIEVIRKCADSIISDDGVVQCALKEVADIVEEKIKTQEELLDSMGQTNNALVKKLNIWNKDFYNPCLKSKIIIITNDNVVKIGEFGFNENDYAHTSGELIEFISTDDGDEYLIEEIKLWAYTKDISKQAGD